VRLYIHVKLDSGGCVNVSGEDLTAEDVNEVFALLTGKVISSETRAEPIDQPLAQTPHRPMGGVWLP
jgi:hypothetical protein